MKIQLKRSNVLDGGVAKAPTAEQMEYGELALNYSATDPSIFIKNSSNAVIKIAGEGAITDEWKSSNNFLFPANLNSSVLIGSSAPDTPTIRLNVNGSASFAGAVTSGGPSVFGGTDKGSLIGNEGNAGFTAGSSSSAIRVWTQGDSTPTVDILGSGSAEFSGTVQAGGNTFGGSPQPGVILNNEGAVVVARGTSSVFIGKDTADGSVTSEITYDGSASFAGGVQSSKFLYSVIPTAVSNPSNYNAVLVDYLGTQTAGIKADGSASFAGGIVSIDSNGQIVTEGDNAYVHVGLSKDANKVPFNIYDTAGGNAALARINGDGSALFTGNIDVGGGVNSDGASIFADGRVYGRTVYAKDSANSNGILFQGLTNSDEKFRVNTDGSASFAGTGTFQVSAKVGPNTGSSLNDNNGVNASQNGSIVLFRSSATSSDSYLRCHKHNGAGSYDDLTTIKSDGSIWVGGNQTSGSPSPNISLNATDGSASFSGLVESRQYFYNQNPTTSTAGLYLLNNTGSTRNDAAAIISNDSTIPGQTISLNYDGSASFSGTIKLGDPAGNANKSGMLLGANGVVASYVGNATTGSDARIYVYNGDTTSYTARINADGSASYANGKFDIESTGQFTFEPEAAAGKVSTTYSGGVANSTSLIGKNGSGTETWRVKADGDATFTGTVTADSFVSSGGGGGLSPTGAVIMFAGSTPPTGWLECDGQAAPSALAAVLGTANVPDLRGEFVRGWDNARGIDAGRNLLSTQDDDFKEHQHSTNATSRIGQTGASNFPAGWSRQDTATSGATFDTNLVGGDETRPRNVALMYIIKT